MEDFFKLIDATNRAKIRHIKIEIDVHSVFPGYVPFPSHYTGYSAYAMQQNSMSSSHRTGIETSYPVPIGVRCGWHPNDSQVHRSKSAVTLCSADVCLFTIPGSQPVVQSSWLPLFSSGYPVELYYLHLVTDNSLMLVAEEFLPEDRLELNWRDLPSESDILGRLKKLLTKIDSSTGELHMELAMSKAKNIISLVKIPMNDEKAIVRFS